MDSHASCEKLVAAEAGLIPSNLVNNIPFVRIPRQNRNPNKLTNYLLISVVTVLLVLVSYEIWQTVRREQLIKEFEGESLPSPIEQLPSNPEDDRIQDLAVELMKLQNTLKEMHEKIYRQDTTPAATELPISTSTDLNSDEFLDNLEHDLYEELDKESSTAKPISSSELSADTRDYPDNTIIREDVVQDIGTSYSSEPVIVTDPIYETEPGSWWAISFHFGKESGESDTSEESIVTESEETEVTTPGEAEITSPESGYWSLSLPDVLFNPIKTTFEWTWGVGGSADEENSGTSESGEKDEEKIDSVETQTVKPQEETIAKEYPEVYDDYNYYEYDDSYEYISWLNDGIFGTETEDSGSSEYSLEDTTSSTFDEDEEKIEEPITTEATVSSTTASDFGTSESSSQYELKDSKDSYSLGSPSDQFRELLRLGATSNSEDVENESSALGESLADSSQPDDTSSTYRSVDVYLENLFRKRLAEAELLSRHYSGNEETFPTGYYDDDLQSFGDTGLTSTSDDWFYISKRSVDTPSKIDTSVPYLTSKELDQKMGLLLQAIDDDNHLLQNEVSLAPEPTKIVLQKKLDNFYAKMEAVSAHIDRLHERYIRLNKLDDDYVSKELPVEELDAPWNTDYNK